MPQPAAQPERCAANTARSIKDDVFALTAYAGTPTCVAALPLVSQARILFFGPFTGVEVLSDPFSRVVFRLRASYCDETALILKQLTALGLNNIAVFYQHEAYGKAGLMGVTRALKARNMTPLALGAVDRNPVDVANAVSTIVPAAPHAVVSISAYKSCAAFIREARKAGYGGTFYNVSFVGTQALADELGREGNGIVVSQVMPYPYTGSSPIARELQEAIRRSGTNAQVNYSSMEGYMAAKVFVEGVCRAGRTPTREQLVARLESIQRADFGGFNVDFSPTRHVASSFVDLSMLTQDGRMRR